MQPAACLIRQGLGQKAGMEPVAHGNGTDDLLEHHHMVGGLQRTGVVTVDLVLSVAAFVVAVLRAHAHLLHGQADLPADVLPGIQRSHVKISAKVNGDPGGATPVVVFKKVELALGAHIAAEPQLPEPAVYAAQKAPAVAAKGVAVRLFYIAEELHHPSLRGTPGQDGDSGQVRAQHKIAFLHMHKACNGAAVKADSFFQRLGQVSRQHGDVFLGSKDIAEGKPHKFDVVVLHKIQNILLGGITHKVPPESRIRLQIFPSPEGSCRNRHGGHRGGGQFPFQNKTPKGLPSIREQVFRLV